MNPSTALVTGFGQRAQELLKTAAMGDLAHLVGPVTEAAGSALRAPAETLLQRAEGIRNLERFGSESQLQRFFARSLSAGGAGGQLFDARHHMAKALRTGQSTPELENALVTMGATARGRINLGKKLGYGGAGAAVAGGLGYGIGHGNGREEERKDIGHNTNVLMHHLPLVKRMQLGLSTIFNPGGTGDNIQRILDR